MNEIRQTLRYCWPHSAALAFAIAAGCSTVLCQIAIPWVLRLLIDDVLSGRDPQRLPMAVSSLVGAAIGTVFFGLLHSYLFARLNGQITIDIRENLAQHMRRISLNDAHARHSGQVMSIFVSDVPIFSKFSESVVGAVVINGFKLAVIFFILTAVSNKLTLITLVAIPAYVLIPAFRSRRMRDAAKKLQERQGALSVSLQESISATREIRAFNRQEWDRSRLHEIFKSVFQADLRQILLRAASSSTYVLYWLIVGVIYLVGGRRVLSGEMSLGSLIATAAYFATLEEPVRSLVGVNQQLQTVLGAGTRIFEFLGIPEESLDRPSAGNLPNCSGKVEFENVNFDYDGVHPVLSNINFTMHPGQRVALVGASGAGKTSIILLLLRLFEPTGGRILIDDCDIRNFTVDSLRERVGVVFQDVFLFAASVEDNIRFGNLAASDEAVSKAAVEACIDEFVVKLPQAYQTTVGERGVRLSGGQKQRIAVARALVRDPQILILDEATSALDSETELAVYRAIFDRPRRRTAFIVAHRLSTILAADLILVLSDTRIIAAGKHDELMSRCALYRSFYQAQAATEGEMDSAHVEAKSGGGV